MHWALGISTLGMRAGPLEFAEPAWLFALLLLVPIIYWWKTSRVAASATRRWVALGLRSALVIALVISLAGARVVWSNKGICVVFVLDQSQSVPGPAREIVRGQIQQELSRMSKDDQFAVVEFGGDAVLGSVPSSRGQMPAPVMVADAAQTDIARALRLAMASFPPDKQKRIVLFSDGDQNSGNALREARIAAAQDVDVDVFIMAAQRGHEIMVDQLIIPPRVRTDAHFLARAIISSDIAQKVQLLATRDGSALDPMDVDLKPGANVIDLPQNGLSEGGYHAYEVTIVPRNADGDTFAANNTGYAFTQVEAPGKVLVVEGKPGQTDQLYDALRGAGVPTERGGVSLLPARLQDYQRYDCVVLDDVNRFDLAPAQMAQLEEWVKQFGGGLVLVGGDDSFGPGGYKGTPLEELSPVEMDVKRQKHLASLAVVIVLDKSGSMGMPAKGPAGTEKMDLANEGACETLKLLSRSDYAMVGEVDTEVKWMGEERLLPMSEGNKARISSATRSTRAGGGGIFCETALNGAYDLINAPGVDTMAKHVIMFADASDSDQQENCVQMARDNYQRRGVTTSVIGLGTKSDSDAAFQQDVARAGHGRWMVTDDANALPKLFAKEAFLVSRQAYVERKDGIVPTLYNSPLLQGFMKDGVPKVYGYVGTTLKPRATLAMHGVEADDPLLAHWSIGLGKCVAFTSDVGDRWGRDWAAWDGLRKFWSQVVRWASRTQINNGLTTTTVIDGNNGKVIVSGMDDAGRPINGLRLQATVESPDETVAARHVPLEQVGPGRYQGQFTATKRGTYLVSIADSETHAAVATGGGVLSYPAEYRDLKPNPALMDALATATGGTRLTTLGDVFAPKPLPVKTFWPIGRLLLVLLAAGLLVDVAWRRLNVADWLRPRGAMRGRGLPVDAQAGARAVSAFRGVKQTRQSLDALSDARPTGAGLRERIEAAALNADIQDTKDSNPGIPQSAAATSDAPPKPKPGISEGYANRLMSAKKRAADQIREQSDDEPH